jgi:hypothetical protein
MTGIGTIYGYTNYFNFRLIRFDRANWHDDEYANWRALDAALASVVAIPSFQGVWATSTAYAENDVTADETSGQLYQCAVGHTSSSSGTFEADRTANPTYWAAVSFSTSPFDPTLVTLTGGTINGIAIGGSVPAAGAFTTLSATGNITVSGTVDGRDLATDGSKLDGIEVLADVTDATNVAAAGAVMDSDFSSSGLMTRTGAATYASRTLTGTTDEIAVSNGDGVSGNPTLSLPLTLNLSGKTVTINGGSISGITDLAVADGGTGASTVEDARNNLGVQQDVVTTRGDIVRGDSSGDVERLALGTTNQVLGSDGSDIVYLDPILQGTHVVNFHASCWEPATTDGCATLAANETSTNDVMTLSLAFDASSVEKAQTSFKLPASFNTASDLSGVIEWYEASSATAHDCVWRVEAQSSGDGDSLDGSWTTAVDVTDTGSSGTRRFIAFSGLSLGSPAAEDTITIRLSRLATSGSDTLDVDANFVSMQVDLTINKEDDS